MRQVSPPNTSPLQTSNPLRHRQVWDLPRSCPPVGAPQHPPQQLLLQVNSAELRTVGQPHQCPWMFSSQQDRDKHNTTASPAAACV